MQAFFIPVLIVFALLIFGQIYFFGRYIAARREIFTNNYYAAFSLGFTLYFAISFLLLLPLIWIGAPLVFYVVLFAVKDAAQILFLLLRRATFYKTGTHIKELVNISLGATILLITFNLAIVQIRPLSFAAVSQGFPTWIRFKEIISVITSINFSFIEQWFGGLVVAVLAVSVINAGISFFAKRTSLLSSIFALFICTGILLTLNFGNQLESLTNVFLITFAIIIVLHVNLYSRRRYSAAFGLVVFAAWSFNPNYFIALLTIAFSSALLYTLMKKPKPLLFWIQLLAPLAATSTQWISSEFSLALGIVITVLAFIVYFFINAVGRLESLTKVDQIVVRTRSLLPITLITTFAAVSIGYGVAQPQQSISVILNSSYIFNNFNDVISKWLNLALLITVAFGVFSYILWRTLINQNKILKPYDIAIFTIAFIIIFALNPAFSLLLNRSAIVSRQQNYLATTVSPLLLIIFSAVSLNFLSTQFRKKVYTKKLTLFQKTHTSRII